MIFLLFLFLLCGREIHADDEFVARIDPSKTTVWGPGLRPEQIVMRARYIFLQLRDKNGEILTESPGDGIVSAQVQAVRLNGGACHIWKQVLDRKDGSFIIRYKLYETCVNLRITIKVQDEDLPSYPLLFKGPVYEEECYCSNPSIDDWLEQYECPNMYDQILNDLEPFEAVYFNATRDNIIKKYHRPNSISICHYVVKDNKIYRQCYGQHVGFKIFMDAILLSLARKVVLPDIELFVNLGDWPLVKKADPIHPIFSWCGSEDSMDIVMPTYDITESTLENMGRVMLDMLSVQGNTNTPWEKKIEKAFWKGRDARRERLDLIHIARKHPDLFNASITNFFFFKEEAHIYGPRQNHTSFFNFFEYKYLLNIDGTVAAYRFPYLLAGDSLVFKQDSMYYEFFYNLVKPYVHYVPVKRDLSDLVNKIIWAKEHDEEARKISRAGQRFARDNLMPRDIFCYHAVLFKEWSKRLRSPVEVLSDMDEVPQLNHTCSCHVINREPDSKSRDEL